MPDFHGPIQHVTIASTLWLLLAFPLLASMFAARFALARSIDARSREAIAIVSVGALALSFTIAAYHARFLASRPSGERHLVEHCWRLVRLGQLDASFDLALDPLSSTMSLVVTGVGLAIFLYAAASLTRDAAYARLFACLNALVFASLLLVLADNLVVMLFGWEGIALCSWALLGFASQGSGKRSALIVGRVANAGLVLGVALFYWGFGGAWVEGDYVPDLNARFASVEVQATVAGDLAQEDDSMPASARPAEPRDDVEDGEEAPSSGAATGDGYLTLTSYAGAVVFMDDARTALRSPGGDLLRSPFVGVPVHAGVHSFRVHPGEGLDDFLVTHVSFGGGREIALIPFGPTVSFREARDQLSVRDLRGKASVRDSLLAKRGWGATSFVTVVALLLFLGAVGMGAQLPWFVEPSRDASGATVVSAILQSCTMVTAGVYLVARLGFFFVLSPAACTVIAVTGAITALLGAVASLYSYDLRKVLACTTVSQLGLMVLALGASGYAAGVFHLVTSSLCTALLVLAAGVVVGALRDVLPDDRAARDVRRMGGLARALPRTAWAYGVGATAITATPIPGLAGFWSKDDVLVRSLLARNLGVPGFTLFFAGLFVVALTGFSIWRAYYLVFAGEPRTILARVHEPQGPIPRVLLTLAVASGLAGLALGVGPRLAGRDGQSPFEDWLASALRGSEPTFAPGSTLAQWAVLVAMTLAAGSGWMLARSRYEHRASDWEALEAESPLFAISRSGFGVAALIEYTVVPLALFARDLASELDRRVVDGFVNGAALATRALAWIVGRLDEDVVDGSIRALSRGTLHAAARVQAAQTGRVQTYVYVLVLGIFLLALLPYWLR